MSQFLLIPSNDYWDFQQEIAFAKQNSRERVFKNHPSNSPRIEVSFPKLYSYLTTHENKFRSREAGKYRKGRPDEWRWYELARPQNLEKNFVDKVLMQELARTSTVVTDSDGFVIAGARAYGIIPQTVSIDFFSGTLASSSSDFFIKHVSAPYSGGYYSYGDQFIKNLPIPPATTAQQSAIAALAKSLTTLTAELRSLEAAITAFPESVTAQRRKEGNVPDLEGLSRIGLLQNLPREVRASALSEMQNLSGQTVFRVGRGQMTFDLDLAELVREALKVRGKLSAEELEALAVPEQAVEQRDYLTTLRAWQTRTSELREQIDNHEAELNDKVYEVYGLEDEREVIETFLARF